MSKTKVLQGWLGILFCSIHGMLGSVLDCEVGGVHCTMSIEMLLDRAIQHAELIYRISEETRTQFKETFIPLALVTQQGHADHLCTVILPTPSSKSEVGQISDKWLLHSVLILVQFWINHLVDLQASLDHYDNTPQDLLDKTKWVSSKLMSLEKGLLTLIRKVRWDVLLLPDIGGPVPNLPRAWVGFVAYVPHKLLSLRFFNKNVSPPLTQIQMLNENNLPLDNSKSIADHLASPRTMEHVMRDYTMLSCFRKDAHKIETFLKLFKCRQTDWPGCSFY
ncbi:somatolactin beta isoform X1 [Electrophorus electricus]|uniref:somatolactin beta isoform X1 n=1 Tax=Electrophorus electricus TaxID=8005 RepID=UPI0015D00727|nr:somatolactin beta isoform X1 [Electrophorus electricus]